MSKDKEIKKQLRLFQTFLTNAYVFLRLIAVNKDGFRDQIGNLNKKFGLGHDRGNQKTADLAYAFKNQVVFFNTSVEILNSWPLKKKVEFIRDIDKFLLKNNLGAEWKLTMIAFLITGSLLPPASNLNIGDTEDEFKKRRVVLILNPDTSLEDIKKQWDTISEKQKKLWPDFKKTSLRETSFPNLKKFFKTEQGRYHLTDEEKWPDLTPYGRMMAKAGRYEEVVKSRRFSKERVKPLKTRNKKTYVELAREINPVKNRKKLKKQANILAQLKRRTAEKV